MLILMIFASRLLWPGLVTGNSQCPLLSGPSLKNVNYYPELKLILVKTSLDLAGNIKYSPPQYYLADRVSRQYSCLCQGCAGRVTRSDGVSYLRCQGCQTLQLRTELRAKYLTRHQGEG